jgi:hypothetical protein
MATGDARDSSPSPATISAERSTASPKRQKPHSSSAAPEACAPETTSVNPPSPAVMAGVGGSGGGGGDDAEMGGWTGLLHSSTKLLEQAAPTPHFPPLQVRARRRSRFLPRGFSPFLAANAGYTYSCCL